MTTRQKLPAPRAETGLSRIKPGFCFTPAEDRDFALGWPHVRHIHDGLPADDSPAIHARQYLSLSDPAPLVPWARKVATAVVRVTALPEIKELSLNSRAFRREAVQELLNDDPPSEEEARAFIRLRMSRETPGLTERTVENFVLLLEGLRGTEVVAESIVSTLETMDADLLTSGWSLPPFITFQLGYLLLRLPVPQAEALRERLAAVIDPFLPGLEQRRSNWSGSLSHVRALDLVLHGGLAAERSTDRTLKWYTHVHDDAALLDQRVSADSLGFYPDPRLLFLGGPATLARFGRLWKSLRGPAEVASFVEQIAPIRGEAVAKIMLAIATEAERKDEACAWFKRHREAVAPFLEKSLKAEGKLAWRAGVVMGWLERFGHMPA